MLTHDHNSHATAVKVGNNFLILKVIAFFQNKGVHTFLVEYFKKILITFNEGLKRMWIF